MTTSTYKGRAIYFDYETYDWRYVDTRRPIHSGKTREKLQRQAKKEMS